MTVNPQLDGKKVTHLLEIKVNGKVLAFDAQMHRIPVDKGTYECVKIPHPNPKNIDEFCLLLQIDGRLWYIRFEGYLEDMSDDVYELIRVEDPE